MKQILELIAILLFYLAMILVPVLIVLAFYLGIAWIVSHSLITIIQAIK